MGKMFYDNDAVVQQFEPLDGVIAFQKHNLKNSDGTKQKDDKKFYKKYKIHTTAIAEILQKQQTHDSVAGFQACEDIYSDPEDEIDDPVDREQDTSKLTLTDVDVDVQKNKNCFGKCLAKCGSMFESFKEKTGCC